MEVAVTARAELEKRIEKKREEIVALKTKVRESEVYIAALKEALRLLPREGVNDGRADNVLRQGSNPELARQAILIAGQPMHVEELLKALKKESTRSNRTGLSGSLAAYVRKGEIFTRPAPNTFGLVELKGKASAAREPVEEAKADSREDDREDVFGFSEENKDVPF